MIFDIDADMAIEQAAQALEQAGSQMSQEKFNQIADKINEAMPGIIQIIAEKTAEIWKEKALNVSSGWGEKYANAIRYKAQDLTAEVYLDEESKDKESNKPNFLFAKLVEEGMKSWSIKDALLRSDKAKVGKDGVKYITIPFGVATPRKKSSGKGKSKFGGREMTQEIYSLVKSGGKISGKLKSGEDISGLTKYNTRQLHSQYGIFRRVSEKSQGWIHPGHEAEPVFPNVLNEVNNQIQRAIGDFCKAIVAKYGR